MFGITVDEVMEFLGYTDDTRETQVTLLLNAAFAALKSFTGRNLEYGTYRDTLQFLPERIYLREWPIESVESFVQGSRTFATTDYGLFVKSGFLHVKNAYCGQMWENPADYAIITYTGGYEELPADIKLAVFNAVQAGDLVSKQSTDSGGIVKRVSVYDVGVTDFAVPKDGGVSSMREALVSQIVNYEGWAPALGVPYFHESEYLGEVGSPS